MGATTTASEPLPRYPWGRCLRLYGAGIGSSILPVTPKGIKWSRNQKQLWWKFNHHLISLRCIIAVNSQRTNNSLCFDASYRFMMTLVAKEKTFKSCNKWKTLPDCHFQVMKYWFIFKEMAFQSHISPEFAFFLNKRQVPVITDKSEMRICPCKLKQFRGNLNTTANSSDPLGLQKKNLMIYI